MFTCKFHGWSYALDGSLKFVPDEQMIAGQPARPFPRRTEKRPLMPEAGLPEAFRALEAWLAWSLETKQERSDKRQTQQPGRAAGVL